MHHSIVDKLFFASMIDPAVLVDYGCADGAVLRAYARLFPHDSMIGYDNTGFMIEQAQHAAKAEGLNILFTNDWNDVESVLSMRGVMRNAVIVSSLYHEAKTYLDDRNFDAVWHRIFQFDNVVFRDMMVDRGALRPADPVHVARIRALHDKNRLAEWESMWGSIENQHSLIHFLLTYRYDANWDRELRENYLPTLLEDFMESIPTTHRPVYFEHYTLPYLRSEVRREFDVELTDRTHLKMLLERR